jgi:hypothetical protein
MEINWHGYVQSSEIKKHRVSRNESPEFITPETPYQNYSPTPRSIKKSPKIKPQISIPEKHQLS